MFIQFLKLIILILYTLIMASKVYVAVSCKLQKIKFYMLALSCSIGIFVVVESHLLPNDLLYLLLFIILLSSLYFVIHTSKIMLLCISSVYIFQLLVLKVLSISFYSLISNQSLQQLTTQVNIHSTALFYTVFLIVCMLLILYQYCDFRKVISISKNKKYVWTLFMLLMMLCIILIILLSSYDGIGVSTLGKHCYIGCSSLMFVSFFIILSYANKVYAMHEKLKEVDLLKQQLSEQIIQFDAQSEYVQKFRKVKHDIANHLNDISYLLHNQKYEHALVYIQEYQDELVQAADVFQTFSDDPTLDASLRVTSNRCKLHNIQFSATVKIGKMELQKTQVCSMFSILMDYVINLSESVCKDTQKFISIRSKLVDGWLVVHCQNRVGEDFAITNEKTLVGRATKSATYNTIQAIVDTMNAILTTEINRDDNLLNITVLIPIEEETL